MACWITFFADGARRNSSRSDLHSRLGDAGFFRADGVINLLNKLVRQFTVLDKSDGAQNRSFRIFGTTRFYEQRRAAMSHEAFPPTENGTIPSASSASAD
jgi:hypothetical protein